MKKLKVGRSSIQGLGVFVQVPIKKGETIAIVKGKTKSLKVKTVEDSLSYPAWIGLGKGVWIDPAYPFQYLNHSCNPSAGIYGKVTLKALRDLKPGEEVHVDYSTIEGDHLWHMKCECRQKGCRKVIKSIGFLPKDIYRRYLPFIPTYFQKVYHKSNGKKR